MALFLTLVGIASGGFVKALRTQRAIVSLMAINDNASLALEQMAREIRTGYNFNKISENELRFINANGINTCYRLNNQSLERGVNCDASGADYKKINADNVKITKFNIVLFGQENDDGYPPLITISLSVGTTNKYLGNILTNIQTTISSRIIGEIF